jgi:hypothetical protein
MPHLEFIRVEGVCATVSAETRPLIRCLRPALLVILISLPLMSGNPDRSLLATRYAEDGAV